MKTKSFRLDEKSEEMLKKICEVYNINESNAIRMIIKLFFIHHKKLKEKGPTNLE